MISENSDKTVGFMLAGINKLWARFIPILAFLTMTSVSIRFEEMMASHRFELQSETKDDHQQSRKLRKCLSRSRCRKPKRVLF